MKTSEIRERTSEELTALVDNLQTDLFKLRVKQATNQLDDTGIINRTKKDIARVHTILRARDLGHESARG